MENQVLDVSKWRSVVATHPASRVSDKYGFIPTTRVIDLLKGEGFLPVKVMESKAIKPELYGFQRHMVRFRHRNWLEQQAVVGESVPELCVVNAHTGLDSFVFYGGIWTFSCANGAVVAASVFPEYRIPHLQYKDDRVLEIVTSVVQEIPNLMRRVTEYKHIMLDRNEQVLLAETALMARYDEEQLAHYRINIDRLLEPKRLVDAEPTLWNTYNVLQEKLVKGGDRVITDTNIRTGSGKPRKVVGVTSVKEDVRLNQALWQLTDRMAQMKQKGVVNEQPSLN